MRRRAYRISEEAPRRTNSFTSVSFEGVKQAVVNEIQHLRTRVITT